MLKRAEQAAPRVSVIIPTYNRAAYLKEALESVFAQTLPAWEVIVVDDGSTDDTWQVVQNAPGAVTFVQQAHQGVAAARNLGLAHARGELIAWLDSDDLWEANFLATVAPLLAQAPEPHGVYTGITLIDARGAPIGSTRRVEPPDQLYAALVQDCFLATPTIVVRRTCYEHVGGFDSCFHIAEDYDMWLRLSRTFRLCGVAQPLARIRVHPTNTMADVEKLAAARLRLVEKHFGAAGEANVLSSAAAAAYGYAHRAIAHKYVEQGQPARGWPHLATAVTLCPEIFGRLDTFYELACGAQPRGRRGSARQMDIAANGVQLLQGLDAIFGTAGAPVRRIARTAYGNAYLALAMLSDQAGDWPAARRYLASALRADLRLLRQPRVIRRCAKLMAGRRLVAHVAALLGRAQPGATAPAVMENDQCDCSF